MIASLGMYDFGGAMAANDRFWALIRDGLRARGLGSPETLTRGDAAFWPSWEASDLVLSQTCGYPFRARLHHRVTYIGTPDYGVEGCPPGHYNSVIVVRAEDPRENFADFDGAPFAYNEALSQSGWAAPQTHAARAGIRLPPALKTGGHCSSARAVAEGRADVASLDAVSHLLMLDNEPGLTEKLRVVARTAPTPGLPFIAALGANAEATFDAIAAAVAALTPADQSTLHLRGLIRVPTSSYLAVPTPPPPEALASSD